MSYLQENQIGVLQQFNLVDLRQGLYKPVWRREDKGAVIRRVSPAEERGVYRDSTQVL